MVAQDEPQAQPIRRKGIESMGSVLAQRNGLVQAKVD